MPNTIGTAILKKTDDEFVAKNTDNRCGGQRHSGNVRAICAASFTSDGAAPRTLHGATDLRVTVISH